MKAMRAMMFGEDSQESQDNEEQELKKEEGQQQ